MATNKDKISVTLELNLNRFNKAAEKANKSFAKLSKDLTNIEQKVSQRQQKEANNRLKFLQTFKAAGDKIREARLKHEDKISQSIEKKEKKDAATKIKREKKASAEKQRILNRDFKRRQKFYNDQIKDEKRVIREQLQLARMEAREKARIDKASGRRGRGRLSTAFMGIRGLPFAGALAGVVSFATLNSAIKRTTEYEKSLRSLARATELNNEQTEKAHKSNVQLANETNLRLEDIALARERASWRFGRDLYESEMKLFGRLARARQTTMAGLIEESSSLGYMNPALVEKYGYAQLSKTFYAANIRTPLSQGVIGNESQQEFLNVFSAIRPGTLKQFGATSALAGALVSGGHVNIEGDGEIEFESTEGLDIIPAIEGLFFQRHGVAPTFDHMIKILEAMLKALEENDIQQLLDIGFTQSEIQKARISQQSLRLQGITSKNLITEIEKRAATDADQVINTSFRNNIDRFDSAMDRVSSWWTNTARTALSEPLEALSRKINKAFTLDDENILADTISRSLTNFIESIPDTALVSISRDLEKIAVGLADNTVGIIKSFGDLSEHMLKNLPDIIKFTDELVVLLSKLVTVLNAITMTFSPSAMSESGLIKGSSNIAKIPFIAAYNAMAKLFGLEGRLEYFPDKAGLIPEYRKEPINEKERARQEKILDEYIRSVEEIQAKESANDEAIDYTLDALMKQLDENKQVIFNIDIDAGRNEVRTRQTSGGNISTRTNTLPSRNISPLNR